VIAHLIAGAAAVGRFARGWPIMEPWAVAPPPNKAPGAVSNKSGVE
jgi:hypothetical protein